jgi:hypothetical protein
MGIVIFAFSSGICVDPGPFFKKCFGRGHPFYLDSVCVVGATFLLRGSVVGVFRVFAGASSLLLGSAALGSQA